MLLSSQNLVRYVATNPGDEHTRVFWQEGAAENWMLAEDETDRGFIFETIRDVSNDAP